MSMETPFLYRVVVVGGIFAVAPAVGSAATPSGTGNPKGAPPVTCELKLKLLEPLDGTSAADTASVAGKQGDRIYREVESQSFCVAYPGAHSGVVLGRDELAEFRKVVKKEPKYVSQQPLRAVATLGGKPYAFAIDKKDGKSKAYSRLYFDANGNGDLTDDAPIDGKATPAGKDNASIDFPQVKAMLNIGGVKVDYAFSMQVYAESSGEEPDDYAMISLTAAAYREGQIELQGKMHRLVLLDSHSSGKFDDKMEVQRDPDEPGGQIVSKDGNLLLIDPDPKGLPADRAGYGFDYGDDRQPLSKLVRIDGRYYEVQVSPAGDRLTLTASTVPLGYVASPHQGFSAVLYGDRGCVAIDCGKSRSVPLPSGQWKLLGYTINQTESYRATLAKETEAQTPGKKPGRLLEPLVSLLESLAGVKEVRPDSEHGPPLTIVVAEAEGNCPPVTVGKAETIKLPFGPPYKPVVVAYRREVAPEMVVGPDGKVQPKSPPEFPISEPVVRLSMSLVGTSGEVCRGLMVGGERPPAPKFTVKTPDGKAVLTGNFEYG